MIKVAGVALALVLLAKPHANGGLLLQLGPRDGSSAPVTWRLEHGSLRRTLEIPNLVAASYSPDGSRLAYAVSRGTVKDSALWVSRGDGSSPHVLVRNLRATIFAWSPDGAHIALATVPGIVLVDAGNGHRTLSAPRVWAEWLAWPRAGTIAFVGHDDRCAGVCAVDVRTGSIKTLAHDDQDHASWIHAWLTSSPRGLEVAFVRDCYSGDCTRIPNGDGLVVERTDGTHGRIVVRGSIQSPVWSPDGRSIAYVSTGQTETSVSEVSVVTGAVHVLWTWPVATAPLVDLLSWRSAGAG